MAGVLHIAATDKATAARAQALGKASDIHVEPLLVKRSYDALVAQADRAAQPGVGARQGRARPRGRRSAVQHRDRRRAGEPVAELAKSAPEGVRVVADPGVKTEADQAAPRAPLRLTIRAGA